LKSHHTHANFVGQTKLTNLQPNDRTTSHDEGLLFIPLLHDSLTTLIFYKWAADDSSRDLRSVA